MNDPVVVSALTESDLDGLVTIHRAAFAGYPNAMLGDRYARAFLRAFLADPSNRFALCARISGAPVGYVTGIAMDREEDLPRELRFVALSSALTRPWLILRSPIRRKIRSKIAGALARTSAGETSAHRGDASEMGLVAIGVSSLVRGRGVGQRLLQSFEDEARRRGKKAMVLSVYAQNTRARRAYEAARWESVTASGDVLWYRKELPQ